MIGWLFRALMAPALCLVVGFAAGWTVHDWRDAAGAEKAVARATRVAVGEGAVNQAVAVRTQAGQDRIRVVTRTIVERIPSYVSEKADRDCVVPDGFVRLHDAAAAGVDVPTVSGGAGRPADDPSGVTLSAVAGTVAANYGACNGFREQLTAWRAWYEGQRAAFGEGPK